VTFRSFSLRETEYALVLMSDLGSARAIPPSRKGILHSARLKPSGLVDSPAGSGLHGFGLAVERAEPLKRELEAFLAACRGEKAPRVDGAQGRQALAVVEAIR
jgi:predicted dehydrogenase